MLPVLKAPELVFGLCSPIGTDNARVMDILRSELARFSYEAHELKVTTLMKDVRVRHLELTEAPFEARYDSYIKYANKLRELLGTPSALAMLCCTAVRAFRRRTTGDPAAYLENNSYIIDQLKRKEEVEALRQVYGRAFILVSIISDKDMRLRRITEKIARGSAAPRPTSDHESIAKELMSRDEDEEGVSNGQRMRDAFALADIFVNIDRVDQTEKLLRRFLNGLFGSNLISPTREEYGMYFAKTASLRSADLSRQVGAAIMTEAGEIISLGCNEVPSPGGGTYWTDDTTDQRDIAKGHDENERIKRAIMADIVKRITQSGLVSTQKSEAQLVQHVLDESTKKGTLFKEALIMNLLEFGRIIHAEMCALCDSARLGRSVKNARLFCTTFPCHMCAKHIVAAGIMDVYFVEPYPKSYAEQLHSDAIIVTTKDIETDGRVRFHPFVGVAPHRYRDLFERGKRKDNSGDLVEWMFDKPQPTLRFTLAMYIENELALTEILRKKLHILVQSGHVTIANSQGDGLNL